MARAIDDLGRFSNRPMPGDTKAAFQKAKMLRKFDPGGEVMQ
jgi:hypothetical protein